MFRFRIIVMEDIGSKGRYPHGDACASVSKPEDGPARSRSTVDLVNPIIDFLSSTPHTILPLSFEVSTSHVSIEGSLDVETGSSGERERKRVLISDDVHDTRTPHQAHLAHPIIRSYRLAGSW
jgi:hypothetical protein